MQVKVVIKCGVCYSLQHFLLFGLYFAILSQQFVMFVSLAMFMRQFM